MSSVDDTHLVSPRGPEVDDAQPRLGCEGLELFHAEKKFISHFVCACNLRNGGYEWTKQTKSIAP